MRPESELLGQRSKGYYEKVNLGVENNKQLLLYIYYVVVNQHYIM